MRPWWISGSPSPYFKRHFKNPCWGRKFEGSCILFNLTPSLPGVWNNNLLRLLLNCLNMKYFYPYSVVMCASTVHLIYANSYFLIFGSTFPVCQIENDHMQFLLNKYSHSHYWIIIYFITTSLFQIVKSLHCNYLTHKCLDSFFRSFSGHSLR